MARVLIVGILVAACGIGDQGDGGGVRPAPPPANLALFAGNLGGAGNIDGTGAEARFNSPSGVATDSSGNVYVADSSNATVRKITPAGVVTTLAGRAGVAGSADGTEAEARFNSPRGVATDSAGNVYVADTENNTIRKITPDGLVSTLAGSAGEVGSADDTGAGARFRLPAGVATDGADNVYVADYGNSTIRKITPAGVVSTLAGVAEIIGSSDGTGAEARFGQPAGVATDSAGNVYVADSFNHTIRKITPAGVVTTLAGRTGVTGSTDGTGPEGRFNYPVSVATDRAGNVYVADSFNNTIRKITPAGVVSTLAGLAGVWGSADGTGAEARFHVPTGIATDTAGNVYVADDLNDTIRKISPAAVVTTLTGSAGVAGSADGTGAGARFALPNGIATDSAGNVYVADTDNHTIRKITPAGVVTTLAGSAGVAGSSDGTGAEARFTYPRGVATDSSGNMYVADTGADITNPLPSGQTIRKITPAGVVTTLAGRPGGWGSADGTGVEARFALPYGIATDSAGNVYVADSFNHAIRKITPAGVVTTLAGVAGASGSADGTGAEARFHGPMGVATDNSGNVYVADSFNLTIRRITPAGVVTTLAGSAGVAGRADGTGAEARFIVPMGLATDSSGNIYVADHDNNTIRKITPAGVVSTVVGATGLVGFKPGPLPGALSYPRGVAIRGASLYITLNVGVAEVTNFP